eukprot:TRINITY_DN3859_c0_g1_i2.p1 TRINITY_DN3859_c0_g1~~TRINITY_DN3859_c0_g1_i2.p1  ORF type:complete len:604 (+),score=100.63 TRINITY_DN3859_c0_g1_i2:120-1931(+)
MTSIRERAARPHARFDALDTDDDNRHRARDRVPVFVILFVLLGSLAAFGFLHGQWAAVSQLSSDPEFALAARGSAAGDVRSVQHIVPVFADDSVSARFPQALGVADGSASVSGAANTGRIRRKRQEEVAEDEERPRMRKAVEELISDPPEGTSDSRDQATRGPQASRAGAVDTHGKRAASIDLDKGGEKVRQPSRLHAYVSIIFNEDYVDGALALAYSLTATSPAVQRATVDLVLMMPPELSAESRARLRGSGWGVLMDIRGDLSQPRAQAKWRATFNKLYMFNLTAYEKIVFWDSDVICHEDPDKILDTPVPADGSAVGAIGARGDWYFKTGNMVIRPTTSVFQRMVAPLRDPRGRYNNLNGRDGLVVREFFNGSFVPIAPVWSQYRRPWQDLAGQRCFHFRGEFKPWFDAHRLPASVHAAEFLEFGPSYRLWWEIYARLHTTLFVQRRSARAALVAGGGAETTNPVTEMEEAAGDGAWGAGAAPDPLDPPGTRATPRTHMWLLRHTPAAYLKRIWWPAEEGWEIRPTPARAVKATPSCHTECQQNHTKCKVNRCVVIAEAGAQSETGLATACDTAPLKDTFEASGRLVRCGDAPTPWPRWV